MRIVAQCSEGHIVFLDAVPTLRGTPYRAATLLLVLTL
jgi:hypothetical protein